MATTNTTSTTSPAGGRTTARPAAPAPSRTPVAVPRPRLGDGGIVRFFREVRSELRKVTWPTRDEVKNLTVVVVAVSVAVGVVLGGIDAIFEQVFRLLLQQ